MKHVAVRLAVYGGAVAPLPNGNWLISWGAGPGDGITLSAVAPSGAKVLALRLFKDPHPAMTCRVQRHPGAAAPPRLPASADAPHRRRPCRHSREGGNPAGRGPDRPKASPDIERHLE